MAREPLYHLDWLRLVSGSRRDQRAKVGWACIIDVLALRLAGEWGQV